ncbi:MAG: hypothetical protein ACLQVN_27255 [Bryobacteraceae bacterium]
MARSERVAETWSLRLERLARSIELLAKKDERSLERALEMSALRRAAAAELHATCAELVGALNGLLARYRVELDPPQFHPEAFQEDGANLFQVNVRGRILQVEFHATQELLSTEEFRVPYTLEGSVRAFNQELLDKELIEEQLLFYTVEPDRRMWRYFDARTYRTGPFDRAYLLSLMELIIS